MYADQLKVLSPGDLYGVVAADMLGQTEASPTRNQHLSILLETTPYGDSDFVAENCGSSFQLIEKELGAAGMGPPRSWTDRRTSRPR